MALHGRPKLMPSVKDYVVDVVVTSAFVRILYFDVFVIVSHHNHGKKVTNRKTL